MFHLDQKSLEHFSEKKNVPLSVCCVILEDHMKDRREITRTRVKRNVKVIIADRVPPFTCTVRDLTTKGARSQHTDDAKPPDHVCIEL